MTLLTRSGWLLGLFTVLALLLAVSNVSASSGDRHPVFQSCLQACRTAQCPADNSRQLLPFNEHPTLWLMRWTCTDECAYRCTHSFTNNLSIKEGIHQFYGKWPFWRFLGCQEPASVLFSIGNGWTHYQGLRKVVKRVSDRCGLKKWMIGLALIQMNTWFWSAVFHTRGEPSRASQIRTRANVCCRPPTHRKTRLLFSVPHHHVHAALHAPSILPPLCATASSSPRPLVPTLAIRHLLLDVHRPRLVLAQHTSIQLQLQRHLQHDLGCYPFDGLGMLFSGIHLSIAVPILTHPDALSTTGPAHDLTETTLPNPNHCAGTRHDARHVTRVIRLPTFLPHHRRSFALAFCDDFYRKRMV